MRPSALKRSQRQMHKIDGKSGRAEDGKLKDLLFSFFSAFFSVFPFLPVFLMLICVIIVSNVSNSYAENGEKSYIIGPRDLLFITVVGHEELTTSEAVRSDGKISFPKVGEVQASGLTASELSQKIREALLKYYKDPQVTVVIKEFKWELIYVLGEVNKPGEIAVPGPVTLLEAMAKAGGVKDETANLAEAKLIKDFGNQIQNVNLKRFWEENILENNVISDEFLSIKLGAGDLLIIPSAIKKSEINVIGNVRNPGRFQVKSSLKPYEALALAGGALQEDADLTRVRIVKQNGDQISIDITDSWKDGVDGSQISESTGVAGKSGKVEKVEKVEVEPGDTMVVLEKRNINVIGHVRSPGQYPIDADISVFEALALAGGPIEESGDLTRIKIIKTNGESRLIDITEVWKEGKNKEKFRVSPGDTIIVPKALKINWYLLYTIVLVLISIQSAIRNR
jgi:protein involved in polysaccharide export with SLBB domain